MKEEFFVIKFAAIYLRAIENLYSLPIKRKVEMINRANSFATEFFDVKLMSESMKN